MGDKVKKIKAELKHFFSEHIVLKEITGIILLIIGILGLLIPIIPGILIIFIGLQLMGLHLLLWHRIKKLWKN